MTRAIDERAADSSEVQAAVSNFCSDNTQRLLDLRSDVMERISEVHGQVQDGLNQKVTFDEMRQLLETKVD